MGIPALTIFLCLDLTIWGISELWKIPDQSIPAFVNSLRVPPGVTPSGRIYLPRGVYSAPTAVTMKGISNATGYLGLEPANRLDPEDAATEQVAGVQWKYDTQHEPNWIRASSALPRVRLVTNTQVSANPAQHLPRSDVSNTALVEEATEPLRGPPGTVVLVEDRPGQIVAETTADNPQLLVLSERFHSGWQAAQEGQPLNILRVNGDFQGCVVGAGQHRVTFHFQPASFTYGRVLSLLGAGIALLIFALLSHLPQKRTP